MPAWSPDDKEIVFISSRDNYKSAWAVNVATKAERKVASVTEGKIDAASYGPGGADWSMNPRTAMTASSKSDGKAITKNEVVFPFPSQLGFRQRVLLYRRRQDQAPHLGRRGQGGSLHGFAGSDARANTYARKKRDFNDQRRARFWASSGRSCRRTASRSPLSRSAISGSCRDGRRAGKISPMTRPMTSIPPGRRTAVSSPGPRTAAASMLQIWIRDMQSGQMRQLTHIPTQPTSLQFSPDGKRIAFVNVDGMWRGAGIGVADVATGEVKPDSQIHLRARHAHLVARRQAHRAGDGGALQQEISRRHQPGPHHVVHRHARQSGREMVRALSPTCRSTAAAGAGRSGRPMAPTCWRPMKANWRSGRCRL